MLSQFERPFLPTACILRLLVYLRVLIRYCSPCFGCIPLKSREGLM